MFTIADIIELTKQYGLVTTEILLISGFIYLFAKSYIDLYVFKKKRRIISLEKIDKNKDQDEDISELLLSEFFRNIRFKITVDIPAETFSEDVALDLLYKDMLICLFTSFQNNLKDKIKKIDKNFKKEEWLNTFLEAIYLTMEDFIKESKKINIPDEARDKFVTWFAPFLQQIHHYANIIDLMKTNSNIQKTRFFLMSLELILINAIAQLQKVQSFGEDLLGLEYKGNIVGDRKTSE